MANRCLLHKTKLECFKKWLIKDGWIIEDTKDFYEVLRATKPHKKPVLIFQRNDLKEHYTVQSIYVGLVYQFIKDCKGGPNDKQRVRDI